MWHLKKEAFGSSLRDNALSLKARLEELIAVPGVEYLHVGVDARRRANSADVVMISRFRDQAALEAYHDHPLHVAVKNYIDRILERSTVVDFPEEPAPPLSRDEG
jgi:quinol monooxygenase YgiN